ncbi:hypothetical protein ANCDUO_00923 [Ancylostoma duodenale]|uniref:Uncharacterized protein n=1 Tax=Ancylostoma duodenale TaxID=51022 RepID=A0A0C2E074_9BILA|nr:hypothetical protein ANCDUO_00923 [Ancylostoma duodenale]
MYSLTRQFCAYEDDTKELALGAILLNKLPPHVRSKVYDKTGNSHNLTPTELLRVLTEIVHKEATLQEIEFHCRTTHHSKSSFQSDAMDAKEPLITHDHQQAEKLRLL